MLLPQLFLKWMWPCKALSGCEDGKWVQFLTDAGQYMIRFGDVLPRSRFQYTAHNETLHNHKPLLSTKQTHSGLQEMQQLRAAAEEVDLTCSVYVVVHCFLHLWAFGQYPSGQFNRKFLDWLGWVWQAEPLPVSRTLTLLERAVALALAVSLDNDYFSRHSNAGYIFAFQWCITQKDRFIPGWHANNKSGLSDATVICVLQGCVSDWDSWSHLRYKTFYLLVQFFPFSFSSFSAR